VLFGTVWNDPHIHHPAQPHERNQQEASCKFAPVILDRYWQQTTTFDRNAQKFIMLFEL